MNRQSVTKAQQPKNSTFLPPTDILQRKTINRTDFEASTVEARSLSGQHIDKPSLPSAESHFSYDFSTIPVTLNSSYPIQAKFKIGQSDDKYEQVADRVADEVMRMPEPQVQRQCPEYEVGLQRQPVKEEEDMVQPKPIAELITPLVQRQVEPEK
ncbi:MAG: hypothetical protein KAV87_29480 [Desulfobacteraceae bacterium]|nr:hypothetical protein [Desulfobacteraceae bacterium]